MKDIDLRIQMALRDEKVKWAIAGIKMGALPLEKFAFVFVEAIRLDKGDPSEPKEWKKQIKVRNSSFQEDAMGSTGG